MALARDTSNAQITFEVEGGTPGQFLVTRYRGTEGLCRLYRFEIEAASLEPIELSEIAGKPAVLSVNSAYGTRWFHGIVSRIDLTGEHTDTGFYHIEIVPSLWMLTHRTNCRIFQEMTTTDIIAKVLTDGGIAADRFVNNVTAPKTRAYCVQYRETDYSFICRLMEQEGIRWYFEQTTDGHKFVITNAEAYEPIEGEAEMPYAAISGMNADEEHVYRFQLGASVRPGKFAVNDFNFENPSLTLKSESTGEKFAGLKQYDFPGKYDAQADGTTLAQIRMQEMESGRLSGLGRSNSPRLLVGSTFALAEHPAELNGSYMVTSLTHQGRQSITDSIHTGGEVGTNGGANLLRTRTAWVNHDGQVSVNPAMAAAATGLDPMDGLTVRNLLSDPEDERINNEAPVYDCQFEVMPDAVKYRPPRITPWPIMRGPQTARVVGPSGEEIYCDKYGRVKVQFHWDVEGKFDEQSSCFMRVSQGLAGGQYGFMFLPRVGHEVIVSFVDGDPDQPFVSGCLYNADHMPPYSLPDEKTKSSIKTNSSKGGGGTNEIRFEDLKDSEQLLFHAAKDMHVVSKNDFVQQVGNETHRTFKKKSVTLHEDNEHREVKGNQMAQVGGDQSLTVKGKVSVSVDGTHSTTVASDVVESFGAGHKHDVTGTYALKGASVKIEADSTIELKCGGSSIVLTPAAVFVVGGPLVNINSGSGPPVAPLVARATSPESPESPNEADSVEPGSDTTYSGGEEQEAADPIASVPGGQFEQTEHESEPDPTSWIKIKLVDMEGEPVPSEKYRVVTPGGEVKEGTLDANGEAYVRCDEPGECEISFPELDESAWEEKS